MSLTSLASLVLLAAAPAAGSFACLVADRAGTGRGVVLGRSACDHCGAPLAARDLVPVLSWAASGGRSRCCGRPLGARLPAAELAALALALWAALVVPPALLAASCLLGWTLLALALVDLRSLRLPDWGTLPLVLAGLALAALGATGAPAAHAAAAALGFGAVSAVAALYRRLRGVDGLGLGDAKLLAAAGAWVGPFGLGSVLLWACAAGLLTAALRARAEGLDRHTAVPFGPGLALGFWITWLHGPLLAPGPSW